MNEPGATKCALDWKSADVLLYLGFRVKAADLRVFAGSLDVRKRAEDEDIGRPSDTATCARQPWPCVILHATSHLGPVDALKKEDGVGSL